MSNKKNNKKKKIKFKRVILVLFLVFLIFYFIYYLLNVKIQNIYIAGNSYFSDQEIIDMAKISNYPKSISKLSFQIKKTLEKNIYISNVTVKKKNLLRIVYIFVEENYPLFYYEPYSKTVLSSGDMIEDEKSNILLINQVPDTIYDKLIEKMKKVDINVLNKMSEIEYKPNEVDNERFFILMNDNNYVYLTLSKFLRINKYIDIINTFNNKKGILYLDSGEYFDVFDE